jgi:hypothetical protein
MKFVRPKKVGLLGHVAPIRGTETMTINTTGDLSREEARALGQIDRQGKMSAQLYRQGTYSEADFVLHGVLERLVIRRRLVYLGRTGDHGDVTYNYGLPGVSAALREPVRAAA